MSANPDGAIILWGSHPVQKIKKWLRIGKNRNRHRGVIVVGPKSSVVWDKINKIVCKVPCAARNDGCKEFVLTIHHGNLQFIHFVQ